MVSKYVELNSTSAAASSTKMVRKHKKSIDPVSSQRFSGGVQQSTHNRGGSQAQDDNYCNNDTDYGQNGTFYNAQPKKLITPQDKFQTDYSPSLLLPPSDSRFSKPTPNQQQISPNRRKGQKFIMSSTMEDFDNKGLSPGIPEVKSKKTKTFRKRKAESGSDFIVKTNSQNMMQFQFDDVCPTEEVSPLISRHSETNLSTSVGTQRSELTKDQLMMRVHKEQKQVMDVLGQQLDRVGNGFAAMSFVMKKLNGKMKDEVAKELAKRGKCQQTRKLFSIYRYRTGNKEANEEISPLLKVQKSSQGSAAQEHLGENETAIDDTVVLKKEDLTKFSSCMHYYKRDLSPIKEAFTQCNIKTPYRQNFENYGANMMSKDFKSSLLKSLGSGVKCMSSINQNRRLSTYYKQIEVSAQPIGQRDLKSFLPPEGCLRAPSQESLGSGRDEPPKPTIKAMLMQRQLPQSLTFNKLPPQQSSSSNAQQDVTESSIGDQTPLDKSILTTQLQKALDQDGPSDQSETLSAQLRKELLEQSSSSTQVIVEGPGAMLIEDTASKESKIGSKLGAKPGYGLLTDGYNQVANPSRNPQQAQDLNELQVLSVGQSQERPSFTANQGSAEKILKQDKLSTTKTSVVGKSPLQPNAATQKINVKLVQKTDIRGQAAVKVGTKVSRQNYQTFNSKQGATKGKTINSVNPNVVKQTPPALPQTQSTRNAKANKGSFHDKRLTCNAQIEKKLQLPVDDSPYESHHIMTQPEQDTPSWMKREKSTEQPGFMPPSSERAHSAQSVKSDSQSSALGGEQGSGLPKRKGTTVMAFSTPNQHARKQNSFKVAKQGRDMSTRPDPLCNSEAKPDNAVLPQAHPSERVSEHNLRSMHLQNNKMLTDQYQAYGVPSGQKEAFMLINDQDRNQALETTSFRRNNASSLEGKPIETLQKSAFTNQTPKTKFLTDQQDSSLINDLKQNNGLTLSNNQIQIRQPLLANVDEKTQEISQQYFSAVMPHDKATDNALVLSPNDLVYKSKRHSTIQKKQKTIFSELPKDLVPSAVGDQFSVPPAFLQPPPNEIGKKSSLVSRENFNAAVDAQSQMNRIDSQDTRFFNQRLGFQQQPKVGNFKQGKASVNGPQNKAQSLEQSRLCHIAQDQILPQYQRASQNFESGNQALVASPPPARNSGLNPKQAINVVNVTKGQHRKQSTGTRQSGALKAAENTQDMLVYKAQQALEKTKLQPNGQPHRLMRSSVKDDKGPFVLNQQLHKNEDVIKYPETTPQSVVTSQSRQRKTSVQRASVGRASASIQNSNINQELYKHDSRHLPQL